MIENNAKQVQVLMIGLDRKNVTTNPFRIHQPTAVLLVVFSRLECKFRQTDLT